MRGRETGVMSGRCSLMRAAVLVVVVVGSAALGRPDEGTSAGSPERSLDAGILAYHEGDLATAVAHLAAAVRGLPEDPRPHYYLGLAQWARGEVEAGQAAIRRGAAIEAQGAAVTVDVDQALARVQGAKRTFIERARREAKAAIVRAREAWRKARYEARKRAEALTVYPPKPLAKTSRLAVELPRVPKEQDLFLSARVFASARVLPNRLVAPRRQAPRGQVAASKAGTGPPPKNAKAKPKRGADPFGGGNPFGNAPSTPSSPAAPAGASPSPVSAGSHTAKTVPCPGRLSTVIRPPA